MPACPPAPPPAGPSVAGVCLLEAPTPPACWAGSSGPPAYGVAPHRQPAGAQALCGVPAAVPADLAAWKHPLRHPWPRWVHRRSAAFLWRSTRAAR